MRYDGRMKVRFDCPECHRSTQADLSHGDNRLFCPYCRHGWEGPSDALADGRLSRCFVCPSTDLFVRKNFPQRLGVSIVVIGMTASCVPWYYHRVYTTFAILFATALIDVVLYLTMDNVLTCYRCKADYQGMTEGSHESFNLEVHERHRQQQARWKQHEKV